MPSSAAATFHPRAAVLVPQPVLCLSATDRVDDELIGDIAGAVGSRGNGASELGNPALGSVEAATAVRDRPGRMEALAVPGAGRRVRKSAARAFGIAGDVEDP